MKQPEYEDRIKRQASNEMATLLEKWKQRRSRHRVYRYCLLSALLLSCAVFLGLSYYFLDRSIPSTIYIRAKEDQSFCFNVPATADIISVGTQGKSNIPKGAVKVNLSQPVTMRTGEAEQYQMQVKLFGFLPFKQIGIHVVEEEELVPIGAPIGIYVKTDGILVIGEGEFVNEQGNQCCPAKGLLRSGDYIQSMNGKKVSDKKDFIKAIEDGTGKELVLSVERDGKKIEVKVVPQKDQQGKYKLGIGIRDNAQGVGTMTYIDGDGNFGALGHGINDLDTSDLMEVNDGTLYQTQIIRIRKGTNGKPGEMTGLIVYSDDKIMGDITENSNRGIFGHCNQKALGLALEKAIPIAFKQEIEKGPAQILCTVKEKPEYYDAEITGIHLDHDNINRGIEIKITDPKLLELTGGIVQGMSGAPIIQKGKFVGAVTHVLVQDSTRGYGIFIENMLDGK